MLDGFDLSSAENDIYMIQPYRNEKFLIRKNDTVLVF